MQLYCALVPGGAVSFGRGLLETTESLRQEAPLCLAKQVTGLTCQGIWTRDALQDALELGVGACEQIDGALRATLLDKIPKLERKRVPQAV